MAQTQLATASRIQKWDAQFFSEYVRDSAFMPYMGVADSEGMMMPILVKNELTSGGKTINIPLVTRLSSGGVRGVQTLEGNEEALGNYNHPITVNWARNGVSIPKPEEHWTEIDLRQAAKMALRTWCAENLRDDVISAFLAYDGGSVLQGVDANNETTQARDPLQFYTAYSEATKDAWLAANRDRFLFGNAVSNHSANDHSAALANIDTTADRMTAEHVSLVKAVAREADRKIRPVKQSISEGRDDFVYFVGKRGFRDLKTDDTIVNANRDARPRDPNSNPLFRDGDLLWDGVIIREIPEIPILAGVGNSSSDVEPGFFCGAQALGVAWGEKPRTTVSKNDDYGFVHKVGIRECRGVSKMVFGGVQHGLVSTFYSAPASA
jgi:hypothetical protein